MRIVVCECGARSTTGGDCIVCGRPLGSISAAIAAASVSAGALALGWALLAWTIGIVAPWFAVVFGGLVSGAVAHASFGRGWAYQAIATVATVVGMVVAHTLLALLLAHRLDLLADSQDAWTRPAALALALVERDPALLVCAGLGVFGGFWLWRQPS